MIDTNKSKMHRKTKFRLLLGMVVWIFILSWITPATAGYISCKIYELSHEHTPIQPEIIATPMHNSQIVDNFLILVAIQHYSVSSKSKGKDSKLGFSTEKIEFIEPEEESEQIIEECDILYDSPPKKKIHEIHTSRHESQKTYNKENKDSGQYLEETNNPTYNQYSANSGIYNARQLFNSKIPPVKTLQKKNEEKIHGEDGLSPLTKEEVESIVEEKTSKLIFQYLERKKEFDEQKEFVEMLSSLFMKSDKLKFIIALFDSLDENPISGRELARRLGKRITPVNRKWILTKSNGVLYNKCEGKIYLKLRDVEGRNFIKHKRKGEYAKSEISLTKKGLKLQRYFREYGFTEILSK